MSCLSVELERLLELKGWSQARLAEAAGVHPSIITRTMRGHSTIDDDNYRCVVEALTQDPLAQAQCLVARLMDFRRGPGQEMVEIRVAAPMALADSPRNQRTHRVLLERAELYLQQLARERTDVADLIIDLAACFGLSLAKSPKTKAV